MNINSINVSNNNKVNSDYYLLNNKISTFNNLIKYLEYLLVDIIDENLKYALKNYTPVTGKLRPYYYLTGSKAINNMVDFLNKSFNFDIHLYKYDDIYDINKDFSSSITNILTRKFNNKNSYAKYIRGVIFNKLKTYDLVDDNDKDYYLNNELFNYGNKYDDYSNIINSLFIKIKLKDDLFTKFGSKVKYTNIECDLNLYNGDNIIYLSFANIFRDKNVNFDLQISDFTITPKKGLIDKELLYNCDDICYSNYYYNLYYLIYNICVNENERNSNLLKINKINNPYIYNLRFINSIDKKKLNKYIQLFKSQFIKIKDDIKKENTQLFINEEAHEKYIEKLEENIVIINNKSLDKYDNIKIIMENIFDIFLNNRQNILNKKKELCILKNILQDYSIDTIKIVNKYNYLSRKYEFFNMFSDLDVNKVTGNNKYEEILVEIIKNSDEPKDKEKKDRFIHSYTTEHKISTSYIESLNTYNYFDLNMYCNLISLNLELKLEDKFINLVNGYDITYEGIVKEIDKIYDNFNIEVRDKIKTKTLKIGNDDNLFDVFTMQLLVSLFYNDTKKSYEILNFDTLKTGDVIEIGQYISTTFVNDDCRIDYFLKVNSLKRKLFKIRLNATYNNWLYIGNYSNLPYEYEVLLKRNSKFIITNITKEVIVINDGSLYDIELIELEILPSFNKLDIEEYEKFKEQELDIDIEEKKDEEYKGFDNYIFSLIEKKTFQKSGFGSYYDLVFKSKIFLHTTEYVYNNFLSKPYKEYELCKEIKPECNITTDEELKTIKTKYKEDGFDIDNMTKEQFNFMNNNLYQKYYKRDSDGETLLPYVRPTYGLSHTLRISIFGQFIALNLLKFNTFPLITELITQEFLIKIGITLLFYVTGKESELSDNIKNLYCCANANESHNNPRDRYAKQSIQNLKDYITKINNEIYDNKLFSDEDIIDYTDAIDNNYKIMSEIERSDNPETVINDLKQLLKYIFYCANAIDLIRIGTEIIITNKIQPVLKSDFTKLSLESQVSQVSQVNKIYIYSPIKFNNKDEFIINNKLLLLNIQKVFYFTGIKSNNIIIFDGSDGSDGSDKSDKEYIIPSYSNPELNIIKYKCETDCKYCIEKILEVSNYYINNLIETLTLENSTYLHTNLLGDTMDLLDDIPMDLLDDSPVDLVLKNILFLDTTEYVYNNFLSKPYKDSELCKVIKPECIIGDKDKKIRIIKERYKKAGFNIDTMSIDEFDDHLESFKILYQDDKKLEIIKKYKDVGLNIDKISFDKLFDELKILYNDLYQNDKKLIDIKEKYKQAKPKARVDIDNMSIKEFNNHLKSFKLMYDELKEDYKETDENGNIVNKEYYRPTHGLSHTLRVCIFAQFIALNLLKFDTFPLITELITQEFLIKISITLLFYSTGRESEAGIDIKNLYCCANANESHNNPRERYANKSNENFKEYIKLNNYKLFSNDVEIDTYADAINNNYKITKDIKDSGNPKTFIDELSKLLKYIFYNAHQIDLIRIGTEIIFTTHEKIQINIPNKYYIYSPIQFNNNKKFINNNKLLVSSIQKIFYFTSIISNDIIIYDNYYVPQYFNSEINIIKYKCETDYKYCIEKLREASKNYINNLIETLPPETLAIFNKTEDLLGGEYNDYNLGNIDIVNSFNISQENKKSKPSIKFFTQHEDTKQYDNNLTDTKDIDDIYNIENNKIKPNYLYLSKKLNINKSKYEFRRTCIFIEKLNKNITEDDIKLDDKYLLFNKIIENDLFNKKKKILDGGFQNDIFNYKYIKYKTKYNNLKMLLQK
jgi:hypothetical protein